MLRGLATLILFLGINQSAIAFRANGLEIYQEDLIRNAYREYMIDALEALNAIGIHQIKNRFQENVDISNPHATVNSVNYIFTERFKKPLMATRPTAFSVEELRLVIVNLGDTSVALSPATVAIHENLIALAIEDIDYQKSSLISILTSEQERPKMSKGSLQALIALIHWVLEEDSLTPPAPRQNQISRLKSFLESRTLSGFTRRTTEEEVRTTLLRRILVRHTNDYEAAKKKYSALLEQTSILIGQDAEPTELQAIELQMFATKESNRLFVVPNFFDAEQAAREIDWHLTAEIPLDFQ